MQAQPRTQAGVQRARFGWAAGCDGATGISRTFTSLDFVPERTGVAIRQIDCRLQWRRLPGAEQMWLFYFNQGFAVVVPLPGGVHRILTIEPKAAFPVLPGQRRQGRRLLNGGAGRPGRRNPPDLRHAPVVSGAGPPGRSHRRPGARLRR